jgi:hypothetical protein
VFEFLCRFGAFARVIAVFRLKHFLGCPESNGCFFHGSCDRSETGSFVQVHLVVGQIDRQSVK